MLTNNGNLPAYPRTAFNKEGLITSDDPEFNGLTKLEAFTKAAMQGLCNSAGSEWINGRSLTQSQVDLISRSAVWIATATLSELSKRQQP